MVLTNNWSNIVNALENGDIKNGVLNGVKFDGAEVKIGSVLSTPIAYYQGDDGEIIDRSDWVVCGFNGAVPEYVKYIMNGTQRVFVKATDDSNNERAIVDGDPVYTRKWNSTANSYDYTQIGTVDQSIGVETFTYGATNTDYGTISIKDPYSVPTHFIVLFDETGKWLEATFAGHNMQLWSKHTYLDADTAGSYEAAKVMMTDSKQCTTMQFNRSNSIWADSYIRSFLNEMRTSTATIFSWTDAKRWELHSIYYNIHSFIEKTAMNKDSFLQSVCKQVNRNWTPDNNIVRTIDVFWLPGCDLMKSGNFPYDVEQLCLDSANGLCEEPEFVKHSNLSSINGCLGIGSRHYCQLRSMFVSCHYMGAVLFEDGIDVFACEQTIFGFSPACSIG